ncbi:hypothetical protein SAMN05444165_4959 [Paraburkholderia phenazinium]|uniref:Uncharacterized protein n=2 Tax=Burkholderiaceae TaxID=119060 RepID=A0A1N6KWB8_9BURK|nr:hypothetical protein SAMN05444165_4959 [Paraburkholderia phenazinium]
MMQSTPKPTDMVRHLAVTYCDDVRLELHNKMSLIGIYQQNMIVPDFPSRVLRLCIVLQPFSPKTMPYKRVRLGVYRDGALFSEAHIDPPASSWEGKPEEFLAVMVPFIFENVEFADRTKFQVRAIFDDQDIVPGPSLVVEKGIPSPAG